MKKKAKVIMIILLVLVAALTVFIMTMMSAYPDKKDYMNMVEPRMIMKENMTVIKIPFEGKAEIVLKEAYTKLYNLYYGLKDVPKGKNQPAPIARYEGFENVVEAFAQGTFYSMPWKGFVAIPVPQTIKSLPPNSGDVPYPASIETLEYGMTAEIVHFGPYENEMPVIEKLLAYVNAQGYEVIGLHEEEYIKGPGMLFIQVKDYITIIRYRVRKK